MNGAERIKEKILTDAKELREKILNEARSEAQNIIANAEKEAFQKVTIMTEQAREEASKIKQHLRAASELEDRKMALKARQDSIDEAFNAALVKLSNMSEDKYRKFMEDVLMNAARDEDGLIVFNERDRTRLGEKFVSFINGKFQNAGKKARLTLAKDTLGSAGGFVLRYGQMEINCTLEILLTMARPALETEVAAILFS